MQKKPLTIAEFSAIYQEKKDVDKTKCNHTLPNGEQAWLHDGNCMFGYQYICSLCGLIEADF